LGEASCGAPPALLSNPATSLSPSAIMTSDRSLSPDEPTSLKINFISTTQWDVARRLLHCSVPGGARLQRRARTRLPPSGMDVEEGRSALSDGAGAASVLVREGSRPSKTTMSIGLPGKWAARWLSCPAPPGEFTDPLAILCGRDTAVAAPLWIGFLVRGHLFERSPGT
jgi:hypothetical protein